MKLISNSWRVCSLGVALLVVLALPQLASGVVPVVKTVPWDPSNPAATHTSYPGATIHLKGTSSVQGATIQADWNFGDGSPHATFTVTNMWDVSTTHGYVGAVGTAWTAILTITDTSTGENASANYLILQEAASLVSKTNVAIDEGLWYLHITEQRFSSGPTPGSAGLTPVGGWDIAAGSPGCISANGGAFSCDNINGSPAVDSDSVQAFEVNNHFETGPASDPYTDDVARGLKRIISFLTALPIGNVTQSYVNASCPTPPCVFNPDSNGNGLGIFNVGMNTGRAYYEGGQIMDAIVATGTPTAVAATGGANVINQTYHTIIQDMVDAHAFCQYPFSPGGAWIYQCQSYDDNSTSQWAAIGLIGASRAFGVAIPKFVTDGNQVWLANSQNANGTFGYQSTSPAWGPFAVTPSGLVQLSMDGVGRGDSRWDRAEAFYRDSFCNNPATFGPGGAPKAYTYGLFSFTKSMLLHDPGGVLSPITVLQDSVNPTPPPGIDWYKAEAAPYDPSGVVGQCDGVARSLVDRQGLNGGYPPTAAVPTNGWWYGHSYAGNHFPFETAWSIIMLRRTVFVSCVNNLIGKGTPSGRSPARIDLTWTGIPSAASYNVLRGTVSGGPYAPVGNTTVTAFSDKSGLVNGQTYFYVLQPVSSGANGTTICESNEAKVTIPATGR